MAVEIDTKRVGRPWDHFKHLPPPTQRLTPSGEMGVREGGVAVQQRPGAHNHAAPPRHKSAPPAAPGPECHDIQGYQDGPEVAMGGRDMTEGETHLPNRQRHQDPRDAAIGAAHIDHVSRTPEREDAPTLGRGEIALQLGLGLGLGLGLATLEIAPRIEQRGVRGSQLGFPCGCGAGDGAGLRGILLHTVVELNRLLSPLLRPPRSHRAVLRPGDDQPARQCTEGVYRAPEPPRVEHGGLGRGLGVPAADDTV